MTIIHAASEVYRAGPSDQPGQSSSLIPEHQFMVINCHIQSVKDTPVVSSWLDFPHMLSSSTGILRKHIRSSEIGTLLLREQHAMEKFCVRHDKKFQYNAACHFCVQVDNGYFNAR